MSKFSEIAKTHLAKLASTDVAAVPEPVPERVIPEVDPLTRSARDYIKRMMMGRPGTPFYLDEMTDEEIQRKRIQDRLAHVMPPRNRWLNPHGERRSIWDREIRNGQHRQCD
jgi:hypothetical protein